MTLTPTPTTTNIVQFKPMTTPAMILAAGRGTRLKDLTTDTPKPLVSVGGVKPFERSLKLLTKAGYKNLFANAWYCASQIVKSVENFNTQNLGATATTIVEDELMDTGGGIKNAMKTFSKGEPFLCVNGDLIWSEETHPILKDLPGLFDDSKMDALLLLVPVERAMGYVAKGDFFLENVAENGTGQLKWREGAPSAPYVYACIQVLHPRLFDGSPDTPFGMIELYRKAAEAGRLYGVAYEGQWADMGTPEGMEQAAKMLQGLQSQVA